MKPFHKFLIGAGFKHAAISPAQMVVHLNGTEFRKMDAGDKINLIQELESGRYSRVHLYRGNDWSEEIKKETRGKPDQRLDEEIEEFKARSKDPKIRYMTEENPFGRELKSGEFRRQVIVLEPKRNLFTRLFNPLGF